MAIKKGFIEKIEHIIERGEVLRAAGLMAQALEKYPQDREILLLAAKVFQSAGLIKEAITSCELCMKYHGRSKEPIEFMINLNFEKMLDQTRQTTLPKITQVSD